jgi:hypothetical protein
VDLALTEDDRAIIAYYEYDSYHYSGNLKVAIQEAREYWYAFLPHVGR